MSKHIPVPPELEHLIEKRESEEDRRQREQRGGDDQRSVDLGPIGAIESAKNLDEVPSEERRADTDRRAGKDRRRRRRRKSS